MNLNTIGDGTSNTIALSERLANCGGVYNRWYGAGSTYTVNAVIPTAGLLASNFGATQSTCSGAYPSSPHSGIILVGMGDGSVRTVSYSSASATVSTGATTWAAALTPNGGEVLSSNW